LATDTRTEAYLPERRSLKLPALLEKLEAAAWSVETAFEASPAAWAVALSVVYLVTALAHSWTRRLWLDELITFYFCRFRNLAELWAWLKTGAERTPPLYHLIARGSERLFGENEIALRLPSIAAYWVMSLAVYFISRKRLPAIFALLAALFPLVTHAYFYACEARPYAMILACSALLLLFWQEAAEAGRRRRIALWAMAVTSAFAVSIHYYGGLAVLPIMIGELARYLERRRPDWPLWFAIASGLAVEACFLPLIRAGLRINRSPYAWNRPQIDMLWKSYPLLLGVTFLPACIVLGLLVIRRGPKLRGTSENDPLLPGHELAACIALAALPVIGYGFGRALTGMMTERYFLQTVIGISILFAIGTAKLCRGRRSFGLALVLAVIVCFAVQQSNNIRQEYAIRDRYQHLLAYDVALSYNLPIIQKSMLELLPVIHYGPPEFTSHLVYPVDIELSHRYEGDDTGRKIYAGGIGIFPVHTITMDSFLKQNDRFLIYGWPVDWLEDYLIQRGATIKIVFRGGLEMLLLVERSRTENATAATAAKLH